MTRYLRMLVSMSGSRHDGRVWREYPAGSVIDVPDWEADGFAPGLAVEVDPPKGATPPPAVPAPPKDVPAPPPAVVDPPEAAADTGDEAPKPTDPKQAWVDHAVSQGEDPDKAEAMTKADLQSRYGGRL